MRNVLNVGRRLVGPDISGVVVARAHLPCVLRELVDRQETGLAGILQ